MLVVFLIINTICYLIFPIVWDPFGLRNDNIVIKHLCTILLYIIWSPQILAYGLVDLTEKYIRLPDWGWVLFISLISTATYFPLWRFVNYVKNKKMITCRIR